MEHFNQFERFVYILDIASYTDQIKQAFAARQNVVLINTANINQRRQLCISFVRNDFLQEIII
ncbi:hypothetical protein D3C78_1086430 [compost metagenome]